MSSWFWHGVRRGIQTTRYPGAPEKAAGVSPGRPLSTTFASPEQASQAASNCPVGAITASREHCDRRSQDLCVVPALPLWQFESAQLGREL